MTIQRLGKRWLIDLITPPHTIFAKSSRLRFVVIVFNKAVSVVVVVVAAVVVVVVAVAVVVF